MLSYRFYIVAFQRDIEEQFLGLQTLTNTRLQRLEESKKLHQYLREVNETSEWITEQLHAASAEDYGKDFEHLEVCVQNLLKRLSSWSRVELYIIRILTLPFCFWLPLVKLGVRWRSNRTLNIPRAKTLFK